MDIRFKHDEAAGGYIAQPVQPDTCVDIRFQHFEIKREIVAQPIESAAHLDL
jgi:hypothetical protein